MSSFQIAKGFTKPLHESIAPVEITKDLVDALESHIAKPKLNLTMCIMTTMDRVINHGDLVHVLFLTFQEKRGKCSSAPVVISVDTDSGIATDPSSRGDKITAAIEDTRVAIVHDDLASNKQESIDNLDKRVIDVIENYGYKPSDQHRCRY